jgi:hypothetical protein
VALPEKFNGYRTLARFGDGDVEMRTKNGANCIAQDGPLRRWMQ